MYKKVFIASASKKYCEHIKNILVHNLGFHHSIVYGLEEILKDPTVIMKLPKEEINLLISDSLNEYNFTTECIFVDRDYEELAAIHAAWKDLQRKINSGMFCYLTRPSMERIGIGLIQFQNEGQPWCRNFKNKNSQLVFSKVYSYAKACVVAFGWANVWSLEKMLID